APERLDLRGECLLVRLELRLLLLELADLAIEVLELGLSRRLALEGHPGEVFTVLRQRLTRLRLELGDARLEILRQELQPLLRGDDVGDATLHVLEQR